jgi:sialic acid synthase SpsE
VPHERMAISIAGRRVAEDLPPFVVAELPAAPGGALDPLVALVDAAAAAGAHAVKLHSTSEADLDERTLATVGERASLRGLKIVAAPTSIAAVALATRLGADAFRIASGDLDWTDLIRAAASTGKPLIFSTGASTLHDVRRAIGVAKRSGATAFAVLHGVAAYPVPKGSENLRALRTLADTCHAPVGLSDHGEDTFAWPVAVGLGASIYERRLGAPGDHRADGTVASTPAEFAAAVRDGRRAWSALGSGQKRVAAAESQGRVANRRSLSAIRDLPEGHVLLPGDLVVRRPAVGLPPSMLDAVVGYRLARHVETGEALTVAHLGERGDPSHVHVSEVA